MIEFQSNVLPKLQPLFAIQDPPQTLLLLLDQIELFVSKTSATGFREGVTPLLYSALESEHAMVQERALTTVPRLCEILEYSHVKEVLFPKIAALFTRTKVLSVKCNTLICFHSMINVLDKYTLTEKLVPLLSRIKTKEPSVMIATLAVYEAMSKKVDRETLGSALIPQLWTMSMGPLLNADQFARFMKAVKEMSARVETEHLQHLKEVKRMQEHTDSYVSGQQAGGLGGGVTGIDGQTGEIDFATLVGSAHAIGREIAKDKPQGADPFGFEDFDTVSRKLEWLFWTVVDPLNLPAWQQFCISDARNNARSHARTHRNWRQHFQRRIFTHAVHLAQRHCDWSCNIISPKSVHLLLWRQDGTAQRLSLIHI